MTEKNINEQLLSPSPLQMSGHGLNTSTLNQSLIDTKFSAAILSPALGTAPVTDEVAGGGDVLPTNRKKAIAFQNLFLIFQFCYNALSKWLMAQGLSLIAIQFYERTTAFVLCALIVAVARIDLFVPKKDRIYLVGRVIVGVTGSYTYLLAVKYLPISISMILFFTGPFWATILAYFFLGEMIAKNEIIAMVVAFSGVIIIATAKQPASDEVLEDGETVSNSDYIFGVAMAIIGAITFAMQSVIVRKMAKINAFTITFWYLMCCSICLLTASLIESAVTKEKIGFLTTDMTQTFSCIGLGALFYVAMQANTIANQNDKSGFVTLIGYLGCCYAVLGDVFIFKAHFTMQEIAGMCVVFAVMIYLAINTIRESLRK